MFDLSTCTVQPLLLKAGIIYHIPKAWHSVLCNTACIVETAFSQAVCNRESREQLISLLEHQSKYTCIHMHVACMHTQYISTIIIIVN